jgi:hypothetical protein
VRAIQSNEDRANGFFAPTTLRTATLADKQGRARTTEAGVERARAARASVRTA